MSCYEKCRKKPPCVFFMEQKCSTNLAKKLMPRKVFSTRCWYAHRKMKYTPRDRPGKSSARAKSDKRRISLSVRPATHLNSTAYIYEIFYCLVRSFCCGSKKRGPLDKSFIYCPDFADVCVNSVPNWSIFDFPSDVIEIGRRHGVKGWVINSPSNKNQRIHGTGRQFREFSLTTETTHGTHSLCGLR